MPRKVWKDDYYLQTYELARTGMAQQPIAAALGISWHTFSKWLDERPALRKAWQRGNEAHNGVPAAKAGKASSGWVDYIYKQLPPNIQELWDKLTAYRFEPDGPQKIEALLANQGKHARQYLFVHALVSNNFCKSKACRQVGVSRQTMEKWITHEADFANLIAEMEWHRENFIEHGLMELIDRGDSPATIFAAKTKLRKRGYNEKSELSITSDLQDLSDLDVPTEVLDQILAAMRKKKDEALQRG